VLFYSVSPTPLHKGSPGCCAGWLLRRKLSRILQALRLRSQAKIPAAPGDGLLLFGPRPQHVLYFKVDALTANMYPGVTIGYHRLR
jgi:hypothetical protein